MFTAGQAAQKQARRPSAEYCDLSNMRTPWIDGCEGSLPDRQVRNW